MTTKEIAIRNIQELSEDATWEEEDVVGVLFLEGTILPHCGRFTRRVFCIRRHDASDDRQSGRSGQAFAGGVTESNQRRPHFTLRNARRTPAQQSPGVGSVGIAPMSSRHTKFYRGV